MIEKIGCTEEEEEVFELIRRHARRFSGVVPRVAGGWVRDKIMRNPSFDMDIALENITGYEFATGLRESASGQRITDVHVIRNNPEKSKHLETAIIKINGLCVDFVNLRTETYSDTRIPRIAHGTPQEDALRRDLTINALFYNLFTREVEDYTGRGVSDIRNKVLMTPLGPRTTLFDDPLRLVRIFRFHSKLGFHIDREIDVALADRRIRDALMEKVSNERIYTEIFKIIHYPRGQYGLLEIIKRDYVDPIFKPPVRVGTSYEEGTVFCEGVEKTTNMWGRPYRREVLNLYTVLCFFSRSVVGSERSEVFSNVHIMKRSLPSPKRFVKMINKIEASLVYLDGVDLRNIGLEGLIRMVRYMGDMWYESLVIYSAIEYMKKHHERYRDTLRVVYEVLQQNVSECYAVRPIVDTSSLANTLGVCKEDLQFYIEESIVYQLSSGTSDPERIVEYLREIRKTRGN